MIGSQDFEKPATVHRTTRSHIRKQRCKNLKYRIIVTFNFHGSVHRNNILIYIQQDAKLHCLFYLETALHVSGSTTNHHQERKQTYLQHLVFVTPLLLSAAIVEELEPVRVCCGWRKPPTAHSNRFQL